MGAGTVYLHELLIWLIFYLLSPIIVAIGWVIRNAIEIRSWPIWSDIQIGWIDLALLLIPFGYLTARDIARYIRKKRTTATG
jgi:hypothetical protein